MPKPGVPESFKVLIKELQSLALDIKVLDENDEEITLKESVDEDFDNDVVKNMDGIKESLMDAPLSEDSAVIDETDELLSELDIDEDEDEVDNDSADPDDDFEYTDDFDDEEEDIDEDSEDDDF